MGALGFGFVIGLCIAGLVFGVLVFAAMLGIPLETRARREKRAALAVKLRAEAAQQEAARQIAVQDEIDRLRGQQPRS